MGTLCCSKAGFEGFVAAWQGMFSVTCSTSFGCTKKNGFWHMLFPTATKTELGQSKALDLDVEDAAMEKDVLLDTGENFGSRRRMGAFNRHNAHVERAIKAARKS